MGFKSMPTTAVEAYRLIKDLAEKAGESLSAFCQKRGVAHTTVMRWQDNPGGYQQRTFLKLTAKEK